MSISLPQGPIGGLFVCPIDHFTVSEVISGQPDVQLCAYNGGVINPGDNKPNVLQICADYNTTTSRTFKITYYSSSFGPESCIQVLEAVDCPCNACGFSSSAPNLQVYAEATPVDKNIPNNCCSNVCYDITIHNNTGKDISFREGVGIKVAPPFEVCFTDADMTNDPGSWHGHYQLEEAADGFLKNMMMWETTDGMNVLAGNSLLLGRVCVESKTGGNPANFKYPFKIGTFYDMARANNEISDQWDLDFCDYISVTNPFEFPDTCCSGTETKIVSLAGSCPPPLIRFGIQAKMPVNGCDVYKIKVQDLYAGSHDPCYRQVYNLVETFPNNPVPINLNNFMLVAQFCQENVQYCQHECRGFVIHFLGKCGDTICRDTLIKCLGGKQSYSDIIQESSETLNKDLYHVWPNPITKGTDLQVSAIYDSKQDIQVSVSDFLGKIVVKHVYHVNAGSNVMKVTTDNLAPGVYILRVGSGEKTETILFSVMQ